MTTALVVVDVQNDFCPGGALAVAGGDAVVPVLNALMPAADLVVATQDWHPADHVSFADNHPGHAIGDRVERDGIEQTLWPVHCVQETPGAALHPALDTARIDHVLRKGQDPAVDSYSGFFDNGRPGQRAGTGLAAWLRARGATRLWIGGLATDYCVRYTVLDARSLDFETVLVTDACRGVDLEPGDVDAALAAMAEAGARRATAAGLLATRRD